MQVFLCRHLLSRNNETGCEDDCGTNCSARQSGPSPTSFFIHTVTRVPDGIGFSHKSPVVDSILSDANVITGIMITACDSQVHLIRCLVRHSLSAPPLPSLIMTHAKHNTLGATTQSGKEKDEDLLPVRFHCRYEHHKL